MAHGRLRKGGLVAVHESIGKIEKIVNHGNYYEAQQMYKSIGARYIAAQKYSETLDIFQSGSILQLKQGQVTCGAELACLFVDTLVKGKFPVCEESLDRVRKIYQAFPRILLPQHLDLEDDMQKLSEALGVAKTHVDCCSSFLKAAIRWSAEFGISHYGCPDLHEMLAEYMYSQSPELDISKVTFYFVRGDCPGKFASALVNFMGKCYPGEDELAIARAVLMYLSLGNMRDANHLLDELRKLLAMKNHEVLQSDLFKFILYLLQTLERDALPLFRILRQSFKSSLDRDPTFEELLDQIAERFYGVRRRSGLGVFGDLFKMI